MVRIHFEPVVFCQKGEMKGEVCIRSRVGEWLRSCNFTTVHLVGSDALATHNATDQQQQPISYRILSLYHSCNYSRPLPSHSSPIHFTTSPSYQFTKQPLQAMHFDALSLITHMRIRNILVYQYIHTVILVGRQKQALTWPIMRRMTSD